jgi:CDP-glycerol glycerophosphotransferase
MAMTAMFAPISYQQIFLTGLPRNDFLKMSKDALPQHLQQQMSQIRKWIGDKRLVAYAPTYRQTAAVSDSSYYQFSEQEIDALKSVLKKHNAVLGFRMHYFRNNDQLFNIGKHVDNEVIFDLGHENVSEIAPVIRSASVVISDYSSVFLEAMYIDKPVLGFMYDLDHYREQQDGLLYDLDMIFPGPVTESFTELLAAIDRTLENDESVSSPQYAFSKKFFFDHVDSDNSKRVVKRVSSLLGISTLNDDESN